MFGLRRHKRYKTQPQAVSILFRHLRCLIKSAEDILKHQPSLTDLQNQASVARTEIKAIQSQLATNAQQQKQDHASLAEEKDGRLNEGCVLF